MTETKVSSDIMRANSQSSRNKAQKQAVLIYHIIKFN